jgi:PmbA protein
MVTTGPGATNAVTGDFSIESAGYLIEKSKLSKFVKSFTIAGNFFDLLLNIEGLSDNIGVEHSGLFRGFASPDVLVKTISVAGK